MTTATATPTPVVWIDTIDSAAVNVRIQGSYRRIHWDTLKSAAEQTDRDLAAFYGGILETAQSIAYDSSPVQLEVAQDETNVWWKVSARALWGGGPVRRAFAADQGLGHAHKHQAQTEANDIAERLRARGRIVETAA